MRRGNKATVDHGRTVTTLFCGAGGDAQGAQDAGFCPQMAANHWDKAVESHEANFPDAAHDIANISQVDPRRYPKTSVLWASPECTNHSGASGRRRDDAQPDLFGDALPNEAAERSRATMWDVIRFADFHDYPVIIVENVVEAANWRLFRSWLRALSEDLGYHYKIVYLNSMHAPAAQRAPQSRDRMYVVAWKGTAAPYLEPRPLAWCPRCECDVKAMQVFKKDGRRWGRYRTQYVYKCPIARCHIVVEPYVAPASTVIDWAQVGTRIGDRTHPLSAATIRRIRAGLERYAHQPIVMRHYTPRGDLAQMSTPVGAPLPTQTASFVPSLVVPSGGTWNEDARSVDEPMTTRTATESDGLLVPSPSFLGGPGPVGGFGAVDGRSTLVIPYTRTGRARSTDSPLPTMTTVDTAALAVAPAAADALIAELRGGGSTARPALHPLATVTASGNNHLLVRMNGTRPGGDGMMCSPVDEPARTLTAGGHQALLGWHRLAPELVPDVEDCLFRMLTPTEIGLAMAFRPDYRVVGNKRERVRQFGNAVTPPAARWLYDAVAPILDSAA